MKVLGSRKEPIYIVFLNGHVVKALSKYWCLYLQICGTSSLWREALHQLKYLLRPSFQVFIPFFTNLKKQVLWNTATLFEVWHEKSLTWKDLLSILGFIFIFLLRQGHRSGWPCTCHTISGWFFFQLPISNSQMLGFWLAPPHLVIWFWVLSQDMHE